jgi:hypothetical protein
MPFAVVSQPKALPDLVSSAARFPNSKLSQVNVNQSVNQSFRDIGLELDD